MTPPSVLVVWFFLLLAMAIACASAKRLLSDSSLGLTQRKDIHDSNHIGSKLFGTRFLKVPYGGQRRKRKDEPDEGDYSDDNEEEKEGVESDDDHETMEDVEQASEGQEGNNSNQTDVGDDENELAIDDEDLETDVDRPNDDANDDEDDDDDGDDDDDDDIPISKKSTNSKRSKTSGSSSLLESSVGSLATAATAAFKFTKGGVKSAVDLVAAKHVTLPQIVGKWRMEQEVQLSKGASYMCPATIEFTDDGQVITTFEGKTFTSTFKFTERQWPRKCTIQFEATAFQGPRDKEPVSMFYKGHFKRSIMNPNVVLIRGKVYKLVGRLLWKQQKRCGKFKGMLSVFFVLLFYLF